MKEPYVEPQGSPVKVRVSFDYYPDEPDEGDRTGMSEEEYLRLHDKLMGLGADDVTIERVDA
jgi:hypothetical protein